MPNGHLSNHPSLSQPNTIVSWRESHHDLKAVCGLLSGDWPGMWAGSPCDQHPLLSSETTTITRRFPACVPTNRCFSYAAPVPLAVP
jgi:hypothetical protein